MVSKIYRLLYSRRIFCSVSPKNGHEKEKRDRALAQISIITGSNIGKVSADCIPVLN